MLTLVELMRSCCVMSDLLRFCCQMCTVVDFLSVALFIRRERDEWGVSVITLCES